MNLLQTIGLMKRSKFEALESLYHMMAKERNDALIREAEERERFKRAATDLAAQAEEIAALKKEIADFVRDANYDNDTIEGMRSEINALRPDAEAMRKKRAADRKRMAGKRNG